MSRHRRALVDLWLAIAICLAAAVFGPPAEGATPTTQHILIGTIADTTYTITRVDDGYALTATSDGQGVMSYEIPPGTDPAPDTIALTTAGADRLENNGCDTRRKPE